MHHWIKNFLFLVFLINTSAFSQKYQPSPENLEARAWFQEARFGLFTVF
jgi:alpha-L-fucosidase